MVQSNTPEIGSSAWLVITFLSFLSAAGIGAILLAMYNRRNSVVDKAKEIHDTNYGKQLEADSVFMQSLIKRVEKLEVEHKEMQEKLLTQAVSSARTEEENKHLKETNTRQEKELNSLREDRKKDGVKIVNLENELHRTQTDLKRVQEEFRELAKKFERFPKV